MAATNIPWADAVWNPITGCTKCSEGCAHCYAERMARRLAGRCGYPQDDPFRVTFHPDKLDEPLHWRKPRRVFVCSMGDLFHEDVTNEQIAQVWMRMAGLSKQTFLLLTKRPQRMAKWMSRVALHEHGWYTHNGKAPKAYGGSGIIVSGNGPRYVDENYCERWPVTWPLPNVYLGVTVENDQHLDRIETLLRTPAAGHVVSLEPLLGPVDVSRWLWRPGAYGAGETVVSKYDHGLDWVICGGETGPGARPMHPQWVRDIRDQCVAAQVPFFFKQMSKREPIPEDLRIREFPNANS